RRLLGAAAKSARDAGTSEPRSSSGTPVVPSGVASIKVSVPAPVFVGDTVPVTANALDSRGAAVPGVELSFSTADTNIVRVDAKRGEATALAPGRARIIVSDGIIKAETIIVIAQRPSKAGEREVRASGDTQEVHPPKPRTPIDRRKALWLAGAAVGLLLLIGGAWALFGRGSVDPKTVFTPIVLNAASFSHRGFRADFSAIPARGNREISSVSATIGGEDSPLP